MHNISTVNSQIVVKFEGLGAIVIDNYDPESDIWTVAEQETAGAEKTPDGLVNRWAKQTLTEATLTVTGASTAGKQLRAVLNSQQNGDLKEVSVIVQVGKFKGNYTNGTLLSGKVGTHLGNEKVQNMPFKFSFGSVENV